MPLLLANFSNWLTPLWLISAGALTGLVVLGLLFVGAWLAYRPATEAVGSSMREGFLFPVLVLAATWAVFAPIGASMVPFKGFVHSLTNLHRQGERTFTVALKPSVVNERVDLGVVPTELKSLVVKSDRDIKFTTMPPDALETGVFATIIELKSNVAPGTDYVMESGKSTASNFDRNRAVLYASNMTNSPATMTVELGTSVEYPQVTAILWTAGSLVFVVLGYLLMRALMPRIMAVATTTAKETVAQPFYSIVLAIGAVALVLFIYLPYNTFGEDVKMLKDSGMTLIMVLAIFVAFWTASVSLAEEIEGRTALTVLSKPLGRPQFVLGKFFGIMQPVLLLFLFLGTVFIITVAYKPVFDARETANLDLTWRTCFQEMVSVMPGLILAFFEVMILTAISVALSTRLPMLANLTICVAIYVLGNLVPLLVQSSLGKYEIVRFIGKLLATLLPVLEHFNTQASTATGEFIPLDVVAWSGVYALLYTTVAILLALVLFEDRDLA